MKVLGSYIYSFGFSNISCNLKWNKLRSMTLLFLNQGGYQQKFSVLYALASRVINVYNEKLPDCCIIIHITTF